MYQHVCQFVSRNICSRLHVSAIYGIPLLREDGVTSVECNKMKKKICYLPMIFCYETVSVKAGSIICTTKLREGERERESESTKGKVEKT